MFSSVSPKASPKRASILWSSLIGLALLVSTCWELGIKLGTVILGLAAINYSFFALEGGKREPFRFYLI
jgi:hypothetical protein